MKGSFKIAIVYLSVGFLWILLSDKLSLILFTEEETHQILYFQTYKGLFYVLSTGLIIFILVRRFEYALHERIEELKAANDAVLKEKETLLKSKQQYKELFDISPLPMWIYCMSTFRFLAVNKAALNLYGYTKNEFFKMSLFDICDPEEVDVLKKTITRIQNGESHIFQGRFKHRTKKGDLIYVDVKSDYVGKKEDDIRLVIANNVTEFLSMQQKLKEQNQIVVETEDKERHRMAGEKHDGLIQHLVATNHMVQMISYDENDDFQKELMSKIQFLLNESINECRWIINDLRPKEAKNHMFRTAVERLLEKYEMLKKFDVTVDVDLDLDNELDDNLKFNLFRIFQENLNNTVKHSNASSVNVTLKKLNDNVLQYTYFDNGTKLDEIQLNSPEAFVSLKNRLMLIDGGFSYELKDQGLTFNFTIPIVKAKVVIA